MCPPTHSVSVCVCVIDTLTVALTPSNQRKIYIIIIKIKNPDLFTCFDQLIDTGWAHLFKHWHMFDMLSLIEENRSELLETLELKWENQGQRTYFYLKYFLFFSIIYKNLILKCSFPAIASLHHSHKSLQIPASCLSRSLFEWEQWPPRTADVHLFHLHLCALEKRSQSVACQSLTIIFIYSFCSALQET